MNTIFVNLLSGPSVGKSTLCALIFAELKKKSIDCEMALEVVKHWIYEESLNKIDNQLYVFGKQHNLSYHLKNKTRVVITDSSLINSIVYYSGENPYFKDMVMWEFKNMNTLNFFLERSFDYKNTGRLHNETESKIIDGKFRDVLNENSIEYFTVNPGEDAFDIIIKEILNRIND